MGLGALVVFLAVAMLSPLLVRPLAALVGRPLQAVFGITGASPARTPCATPAAPR